MRKNIGYLLMAVVAVFASATSSRALLIDLTDSGSWSGLDDQPSFAGTIDGLSVTVFANLGTMSFNGDEGPGLITLSDGTTLAGNGDGVGIQYKKERDREERGELNSRGRLSEILTVTFDRRVAINALYVLDLFSREVAQFTINEIERDYEASSSGAWGFHEIPLEGGISSTAISFSVPKGGPGDDGDHDFAVAGIKVSQIPLPASISLLGAGLLGLVGLRRKFGR